MPTKPAVSARPSSGDAEMSASNSEPEENSWGSKEQKLRLNRGTEGKKVQRRGRSKTEPRIPAWRNMLRLGRGRSLQRRRSSSQQGGKEIPTEGGVARRRKRRAPQIWGGLTGDLGSLSGKAGVTPQQVRRES